MVILLTEVKCDILGGLFLPAFTLDLTGSWLGPFKRLLGAPALPPAPWFSCLTLSFAFRLSFHLSWVHVLFYPSPYVSWGFLRVDWCSAGSQGARDEATALLAGGEKRSKHKHAHRGKWRCPETGGKQPAGCEVTLQGWAAEEGRAEAESGPWTPSDPTQGNLGHLALA